MIIIALEIVGALVAIAAVTVPAARWVVGRIAENQRRDMVDLLTDNKRDEAISAIREELAELAGALKSHMATEERHSRVIDGLQQAILDSVGRLEKSAAERAVQIVKSIAALADRPTLLLSVHRDGTYDLDWANQAWLEWAGLTLPEARGGGWFKTIDAREREVVRQGSEIIGQEQELYDSEYTFVNALTQEPVGRVRAVAFPLEGPTDDEWFYVKQITKIDEA